MLILNECELKDGGTSTGTGFYYSTNCNETGHAQVIITNKHVIEDETGIIFGETGSYKIYSY